MSKEEGYYRSLYESLRRKYKKEIEQMQYRQARMSHLTYDLLKCLGLSDREIMDYYGTERICG